MLNCLMGQMQKLQLLVTEMIVMIFIIVHVYVIHFDVIAFSKWQLNEIMSYFISTPYERCSE